MKFTIYHAINLTAILILYWPERYIFVNSNAANDLSNMLHSLSFTSLITEPTGVTINSRTLLDQIWTSIDKSYSSYILNNKITDHYLIFTSFKSSFRGSFMLKKFRDHYQPSCGRVNTMFLDQFSYENILVSCSSMAEILSISYENWKFLINTYTFGPLVEQHNNKINQV